MHHNDRHSVAKAPMVQLLTTIREVFHPFHGLGPSLQWGSQFNGEMGFTWIYTEVT